MTESLRVLFDAYWWRTGPAANRSVQRELILAWARCFPEDELALAVRASVDPTDAPAGADVVRTRLWPHGLANAIELGRHARRSRSDVVIAHNYTPLRGTSATFIHDVMFEEHPEWFSRAERAYFAGMLPLARRARLIATSTQTEAARIVRHRRGTAPIVPIGLAVPSALAAAEPRPPRDADEGRPFAVTVGRLNIRKNLDAVIAGAAHSSRISPSSPLFVVGSAEHSGVGADLPEGVADLVRAGSVRFLGRLDDAELAWLYSHAQLCISLSRDEGFGLTPIEAAWFGAPTLVSDIPVHRETVGDYARFVSASASAPETGAAIDSAWGVGPSVDAVEAVRGRYTWEGSARRLRAAIAELVIGGEPAAR